MKKILSILVLSMFVFVGVNAQSCCSKKSADAKTCSAKSEKSTKVAAMYLEADKLAEADENIKKRVCSISGNISYYQKVTNEESNLDEWVEVKYDEDQKQFTRVASAMVVRELEKVDAKAKNKKKACCSKGAKSCSKKAGK
jgi:hypothetical protein